MAKKRAKKKKDAGGANLGFEAKMWLAADAQSQLVEFVRSAEADLKSVGNLDSLLATHDQTSAE